MRTPTHRFRIALLIVLAAWAGRQSLAHCQIPCGIYDDELRGALLAEHITTIEKSIQQIVELSSQEKPDYNNIVRWVQNKEDHVSALSEIVTYYFMAQRVKPVDAKGQEAYSAYIRQVTLLHQMLVAAMKAKQTTDVKYVEELRGLLTAFRSAYPGLSADTK